jgi:copper homeostasis protein
MIFKLEICVDSAESALNAQKAGAGRIELCTNLMEGGTTPGSGIIAVLREKLDLKIHVLIRPRGGDFLYSDLEYEMMKRDIKICRDIGVDGVVLGMLTHEGKIDIELTSGLVEYAHPLSVTFHRAFDMCSDPFRGLEDIITTGAHRVLTSGQKNKAVDGRVLIKKLNEQAGNRIIIMPGSGLTASNIELFARETGSSEFHLTGRKTIDSEMRFRKDDVNMRAIDDIPEYSRKVADTEMIKKVVTILENI